MTSRHEPATLISWSVPRQRDVTPYRSPGCADVLRGARADVTDFSYMTLMDTSVVKHNMLKMKASFGIFAYPGCYTSLIGRHLPTFRDNVSVPSLRAKQSSYSWIAWTLKLVPTRCTETSVTSDQRWLTSKKNEDLIFTVTEAWTDDKYFCVRCWTITEGA